MIDQQAVREPGSSEGTVRDHLNVECSSGEYARARAYFPVVKEIRMKNLSNPMFWTLGGFLLDKRVMACG